MTTTPDYRAFCAELLEALLEEAHPDDVRLPSGELTGRLYPLVAKVESALLAAPEAVGVADEEIDAFIYHWWEEYGKGYLPNSSDSALVKAALARFAHPAPVPVGERPWEWDGWCDAEGYCWAFFNRRWELWQPACLDATVLLLPHWALPLPS